MLKNKVNLDLVWTLYFIILLIPENLKLGDIIINHTILPIFFGFFVIYHYLHKEQHHLISYVFLIMIFASLILQLQMYLYPHHPSQLFVIMPELFYNLFINTYSCFVILLCGAIIAIVALKYYKLLQLSIKLFLIIYLNTATIILYDLLFQKTSIIQQYHIINWGICLLQLLVLGYLVIFFKNNLWNDGDKFIKNIFIINFMGIFLNIAVTKFFYLKDLDFSNMTLSTRLDLELVTLCIIVFMLLKQQKFILLKTLAVVTVISIFLNISYRMVIMATTFITPEFAKIYVNAIIYIYPFKIVFKMLLIVILLIQLIRTIKILNPTSGLKAIYCRWFDN